MYGLRSPHFAEIVKSKFGYPVRRIGAGKIFLGFETKATTSRMIEMPWFKKSEKKRLLSASPAMIASSLHRLAERNNPSESLDLPEEVYARFREKVFLYREANVLLALVDRVNPSSDDREPLFEPVFWEYERIIFWELPDPVVCAAKRQSVAAALQDLNFRMHPPMVNKWDFAVDWSRNWFAGIGHNEMSLARLEWFSRFWAREYSDVQKVLEAAVTTSRK